MFDEKRYTQEDVDNIVCTLWGWADGPRSSYANAMAEISYLEARVETLERIIDRVRPCHDAMLEFLSGDGIDWNCEIYG